MAMTLEAAQGHRARSTAPIWSLARARPPMRALIW
jgi:hypothetical protein